MKVKLRKIGNLKSNTVDLLFNGLMNFIYVSQFPNAVLLSVDWIFFKFDNKEIRI